jgi:hypothetical protein
MTERPAPALLVAIDTEGDNQWDPAARRCQTFENIYGLGRLHEFFVRHGVRPTYVVTYPVARDARSAAVLRELHRAGSCEIGAHHHAWETPPFDRDDVDRHSYALWLPRPKFEEQLTSLTGAIADAVGTAPVSYRSGRFGFAAEHVSPLEAQGYLVDSSIAPLFYEAHKRGPDFVGAPLTPYYLSYDDPVRPGTSGVLELPLSAALSRRVPAWLERLYGRAPWPYTTKRVLRLARIAEVRWLRPSYASAESMIALGRQVAASGAPILNLLFHSSEAMVGGSPYNKTDSELEAFLARLSRFLTFATSELGARPMTLTEYRNEFVSAPYAARIGRTA